MIKKKLTESEISSIPKLYSSGLPVREIAKKLHTCHSNILFHLQKIDFCRRTRSCAAIEGVKAGRIYINRNKIPNDLKLTADLAYILGVLAGDGYMDYSLKRKAYKIGLDATDPEFVKKFQYALSNYFKLKSSYEFRTRNNINWNNIFVTRLCSKEACDFINSIGNFKTLNWGVPSIIKEADLPLKCLFIKGFFDSEGEIELIARRIGASSANPIGLEEIGNLLTSLGIKTTIIKVKDNRPNTHQKYRLRISDKVSVKAFNSQIGFTIRRKQVILDTITKNTLNSIKPKTL